MSDVSRFATHPRQIGSEGGEDRMLGKKKPVFICGPCMHKFDPATVKLSEVGPRHKDVCTECGKRTYGALCNLETVKRERTR